MILQFVRHWKPWLLWLRLYVSQYDSKKTDLILLEIRLNTFFKSLSHWFRMFLPKVKYCLSWSWMARAIHRSLLIWPSSVIVLYKAGVWHVAVSPRSMSVSVIHVWLASALLSLPGFARITRTFVLISAVLLDYEFTLCWLQTFRWFTRGTTKVILCFYKAGSCMSFFVVLERVGALNMVSPQGIFYENWINSTQWWEKVLKLTGTCYKFSFPH